MNTQILKPLWIGFKKGAWAPITVFAVHTLFAQVLFVYYARFSYFDSIEHFVGGVAMAYFFYHLLASVRTTLFQPGYERAMQCLLVFLATGTTTIFWEFCEFILDRTLVIHGLRQGSIGDTMADMALGMAGALCYLLIAKRKS